MGWLDSFTGKSQRRDINDANANYRAALNTGRMKALNALDTGKSEAQGYYEPYQQVGTQGAQDFDLYRKSIGLGGQEGYDEAFEVFDSDPFRDYRNQNVGNVLRDSFRRYNAGGMANSGINMLAQGRIGAEYAENDVNDWRNRLAGVGQTGINTGLNVAGSMAGISSQDAARRADLETSIYSAIGNQAINHGNAMASSRNIGWNNLMGLVGAGTNAMAAYNGIPRRVG